ncbi:MAG: zinc metalloprotease HtpX [Candidatus Nitrohelix vancouverensis]|uniref:Protease HtpX homolog n=1 Tax=Candidatus Nitrohelix vancouverensis TaxID=2705534 RepID=A0A7T0C1B0_9BACT|nr:MAG: zinc metalloprotease HtpX [Candidatus Nitrohelix vancouverensis]
MNTFKTTLLLTSLTLLLVMGGMALGGQEGMVMAFIIAMVMNFGAYFFSDKLALSMYGAQEVSEREFPDVHRIVRDLSRRAEIPMPRIFHIPSEQPNAFATGRNPEHASVAFTDGILNILDEREFAGVMAHEIGHIKNRDILLGTIAATLAGAISMLANIAQWGMIFGGGRGERNVHPALHLLMIFLAPIAALLIQMAISRTREYKADATGAQLMADAAPLASALRKLEQTAQRVPMHNAEPATAHMFIVSPLAGVDFASLFSTHPPIEKRVAKLQSLNTELKRIGGRAHSLV